MYSGQTSSISRSGNSWVQLGNGGFKQRPSIINFYQPSDAVLRRKNLQKQVKQCTQISLWFWFSHYHNCVYCSHIKLWAYFSSIIDFGPT